MTEKRGVCRAFLRFRKVGGIKRETIVHTFWHEYCARKKQYVERMDISMRNIPKARRVRRKPPVMVLSLLIGLLSAALWGGWSLGEQQKLADKVVRLHILANSDSDEDQVLKLRVRDSVLTRAEEILTASDGRQEAEKSLRGHLGELAALAGETVEAEGYAYPVTVELANTLFPTREYPGFRLPAGEYLALRVVIGEGGGRNWWCVVFPPLCAQSTTDLAQTAMSAGLAYEDVALMTEADSGYVLKFKSIELWEWLKTRMGG